MEAYMNAVEKLGNSATFPTFLNWGSSATPCRAPDEPSARYTEFSCYVNEFTLYHEPPKVEQVVVYK
jgi:hypothetical protein